MCYEFFSNLQLNNTSLQEADEHELARTEGGYYQTDSSEMPSRDEACGTMWYWSWERLSK